MPHPFDDLRAALGGAATDPLAGAPARVDAGRQARTGIPEVVLASSKSPEQVVAIAGQLLERSGRAIVSRASPETVAALLAAFGERVERPAAEGQVLLVAGPGTAPAFSGGRVGVITAGTGDLAVASEAAIMAREMGCAVEIVVDVGVAGLHRLIDPLRQLLAWPVDVIIVAAGMDGALPSVVAGLVDVPVIGLPTSVGYGMGGRGEAALLSMLQTCVPGLAVVNIDNGIGAGAIAARIANGLAAARGRASAE